MNKFRTYVCECGAEFQLVSDRDMLRCPECLEWTLEAKYTLADIQR